MGGGREKKGQFVPYFESNLRGQLTDIFDILWMLSMGPHLHNNMSIVLGWGGGEGAIYYGQCPQLSRFFSWMGDSINLPFWISSQGCITSPVLCVLLRGARYPPLYEPASKTIFLPTKELQQKESGHLTSTISQVDKPCPWPTPYTSCY